LFNRQYASTGRLSPSGPDANRALGHLPNRAAALPGLAAGLQVRFVERGQRLAGGAGGEIEAASRRAMTPEENER
jgi:hypothetical protein